MSSGFGYGGPSFSSSKDLTISARFALWDNLSRSLVSYGYVQAVDENSFAVSLEDWHAALASFTEKIFSGTAASAGGF
jgi:hypothetical protein